MGTSVMADWVLERHGWYTTEQTAPFSLFSSRVSEDEKARIAARILTNPFPDSMPLGPPSSRRSTTTCSWRT